jgi:hypothetical protein
VWGFLFVFNIRIFSRNNVNSCTCLSVFPGMGAYVVERVTQYPPFIVSLKAIVCTTLYALCGIYR